MGGPIGGRRSVRPETWPGTRCAWARRRSIGLAETSFERLPGVIRRPRRVGRRVGERSPSCSPSSSASRSARAGGRVGAPSTTRSTAAAASAAPRSVTAPASARSSGGSGSTASRRRPPAPPRARSDLAAGAVLLHSRAPRRAPRRAARAGAPTLPRRVYAAGVRHARSSSLRPPGSLRVACQEPDTGTFPACSRSSCPSTSTTTSLVDGPRAGPAHARHANRRNEGAVPLEPIRDEIAEDREGCSRA